MRVLGVVLLLLGTVSAVSGGVVAYTMTFGKSAVCELPDESSDDSDSQPAVFRDVSRSFRVVKAPAAR